MSYESFLVPSAHIRNLLKKEKKMPHILAPSENTENRLFEAGFFKTVSIRRVPSGSAKTSVACEGSSVEVDRCAAPPAKKYKEMLETDARVHWPHLPEQKQSCWRTPSGSVRYPNCQSQDATTAISFPRIVVLSSENNRPFPALAHSLLCIEFKRNVDTFCLY